MPPSQPKRRPATGPNPTDRGKPGTKRHLVTDARGTPLMVSLSNHRLEADRGQPARQPADGPDPRCHPAAELGPARTTAPTPRQAACQQGLRRQGTSARVPGARDRAAHCPQGHRKQSEAWASPLGGRSFDRLKMRVPMLGSTASGVCPSATSAAPTSTRPSPALRPASSPSTRSGGSVRRS